MKLFGIFNIGGTPSVPATSPAQATVTSAPVVESQGYRAGEPPQDLSKFETTYGSLPYLDGSFRAGIYFGRPPGDISPQTVAEIVEKIGTIISPDDKKELDAIFESDAQLEERMARCGFFMSTIRASEAKREAEQKIRAGESVVITTREQIIQQMTVEREVIHELKRQNADKVYQILKPACDRFAKITRKFVLDEDRIERGIHRERHGSKSFTPSLYLSELCFVALAVAHAPVRNYVLCRNLRAPDPAKPLIDIWLSTVPAVPVQTVLPARRPAEDLRELDLKARQAADAEAHKFALAEKNALTEKIKADIKKTAEETELASMKADMDEAARKEVLKKKLQDAADTTKSADTKP
jgi:hypothetical protein